MSDVRKYNSIKLYSGPLSLFGTKVDIALREATTQINIFRASLHPEGVAAYTKNFEEWRSYLLQLLQRLKLTNRDEGLNALTEEMLEYPNVQATREYASRALSPESSLLVPCVMELHGQELSLFTTLTIFGSPRDITLHELFIELFYPADPKTEQFLKSVTALES